MKYKIQGVVCPKTWKTVGKANKAFTLVIDSVDLSKSDSFTLNGEPIIIVSPGNIVDNGRRYKVVAKVNNNKGFSVEALTGFEFIIGRAEQSTDNVLEQSEGSILTKLRKWFRL